MTIESLASQALESLRGQGRAERAEVMRGYAPTVEEHLGATAPQARAEAAKIARALRGRPLADVVAAAEALLALGCFDTRLVASYLLGRRPDAVRTLGVRDVERLAKGNDNWASVDSFTAAVAGPAWRDGGVSDDDVRRWSASEDVWTRRMSLVATTVLNRAGGSESERTLELCERLVADPHPLIRKAISWSLRSLAPTAPATVRAFLAAHPDLPRGVVREVESKLATGRKNPRA